MPDELPRADPPRNRADEVRHLNWINKALDQRLWETTIPSQPSM